MVMRRLVKRRDWRQQAESGVTSQVPEAKLASQRRALRSKTPFQMAGIKTAVFASLRKVLLFYLREQLTFGLG